MNLLRVTQSNAVSGLGTNTHTVTVAGLYHVECKSSIVPPSGLSIVINLNGSPIATSKVPTINDIWADVHASFNASINDVITVVLSSSSIQDSVSLNNVKSIITVDRL